MLGIRWKEHLRVFSRVLLYSIHIQGKLQDFFPSYLALGQKIRVERGISQGDLEMGYLVLSLN